MMQTELKLSIVGFPPMSARNCSQELFTLSGGAFYRDINGKLVFFTDYGEHKYKTVITCKDNNLPAFSGLYIGAAVDVECIQYLWKTFDVGVKSWEIERLFVKDSVIVVDDENNHLKFQLNDKLLRLEENPRGCYIGFRPKLTMHVIDFSTQTDEWGLSSSWKLVMEEV